jgi:hypothetical protein
MQPQYDIERFKQSHNIVGTSRLPVRTRFISSRGLLLHFVFTESILLTKAHLWASYWVLFWAASADLFQS